MDIRFLDGLGPLKFGMTQAECMAVLGECKDTEILEAPDDSRSLVWHYWDIGCSLFFNLNGSGRLCCVETDDRSEASYAGVNIFTLKEKEFLALMKSNKHAVTDTEKHPWGEKRITFDELYADFYFENGNLVSVNYSCPEEESYSNGDVIISN